MATGLGGDGTGLMALGWRFAKYFMINPEKGARTSIYLAESSDVEGISGRYFHNCRDAPTAAAARNVYTEARLWKVSAGLAGLEG